MKEFPENVLDKNWASQSKLLYFEMNKFPIQEKENTRTLFQTKNCLFVETFLNNDVISFVADKWYCEFINNKVIF